jgi:hypothetical protein
LIFCDQDLIAVAAKFYTRARRSSEPKAEAPTLLSVPEAATLTL